MLDGEVLEPSGYGVWPLAVSWPRFGSRSASSWCPRSGYAAGQYPSSSSPSSLPVSAVPGCALLLVCPGPGRGVSRRSCFFIMADWNSVFLFVDASWIRSNFLSEHLSRSLRQDNVLHVIKTEPSVRRVFILDDSDELV